MKDGNREYILQGIGQSGDGTWVKLYSGPTEYEYLIQVGSKEDSIYDDGVGLSWDELTTLKGLLSD